MFKSGTVDNKNTKITFWNKQQNRGVIFESGLRLNSVLLFTGVEMEGPGVGSGWSWTSSQSPRLYCSWCTVYYINSFTRLTDIQGGPDNEIGF